MPDITSLKRPQTTFGNGACLKIEKMSPNRNRASPSGNMGNGCLAGRLTRLRGLVHPLNMISINEIYPAKILIRIFLPLLALPPFSHWELTHLFGKMLCYNINIIRLEALGVPH